MKSLLIAIIMHTAQVGNTAPTVQAIETGSEAMCQVLSNKMLEVASEKGAVVLTACTAARPVDEYMK